jgi:hypothetical protein
MKLSPTRKSVLFAALLVLAAAPGKLYADVTPKIKSLGIDSPKQVFFVGNSYLYYGDSLHNHVVRLAIKLMRLSFRQDWHLKKPTRENPA